MEAFTCLMIFKNIFSFGLTFSAYDWLLVTGAWEIFVAMGSVQVAICLLSVPMCKHHIKTLSFSISDFYIDIFGKKNRALMKKYDLLAMLHLW